ncbi:MAG TPA: DinB family protein [Ohtaekwangia sp.]|nr:DinB family protein [Ohtaekwangia sp.]
MTITIKDIINNLKRETIRTFALLDAWFDRDDAFEEKPATGWHIGGVLEHVMLANHHLLIVIDKACDEISRKIPDSDLEQSLHGYTMVNRKLEAIAVPGTFDWQTPPGHMPSGSKPLPEVRDRLRDQLYRCLCILERLPNGEGTLHQVAMPVNDLGKMDVYQHIYFLTQHIRRHLTQMEKIRFEVLHHEETPYQR